uniref:Rhodanese domain-containing protein n=1 Tax=Kalanchoe fedtschenkoi TaxID=63787 RepID=A0A7N0UHS6_KALFE
MEALTAAALIPSSILSINTPKPRKFQSLPTITKSLPSSSTSYSQSKPQRLGSNFHGGLVLLSSIFNAKVACALTYEEALQQSVSSPTSSDEFDVSGVIDSVISFGAENPVIVFGGVAVVAVPLIVSQLLKGPEKAWGVVSARNAYAKLGEQDDAQLLDIRPLKELKEKGSPDIGGLRKKSVSVVYNGEDKPGFLKKLALKFKEPENTTLFIIDKFDGNSELVAELVTVNGFKAAYAIKDGTDGPRGWLNSGLPWTAPKKSLSLNLGGLTESFSGVFDDTSDVVSLTLTLAVATGLSLLAFTETETILQLLGSAALVQFVSTKLLLAEDRKKTLKEITDFVDTKIAPTEFVGELTEIGKALLPTSVVSKALPAPTTTVPEQTTSEATSEPAPAPQVAPSPPEVVNSVPKPQVKTESLPGFSRPLSPYASYPDYKPPTSPTPSPP